MTQKDDIFDVSIFIITDNNEIVYNHEYDASDCVNGRFVMLTNDRLNSDYGENNSLFIEKDWKEKTNSFNTYFTLTKRKNAKKYFDHNDLMWQKENRNIPNVKKIDIKELNINELIISQATNTDNSKRLIQYVDGYRHTNDIIMNSDIALQIYNQHNQYRKISKNEYIPCIMAAYNSIMSFNGKSYHGFLPSIGQLIYLSENLGETNDALSKIGNDSTFEVWNQGKSNYEKDGGLSNGWWSCNEYDDYMVWCLEYGIAITNMSAFEKDANWKKTLVLYPIKL